MKLTLSFSLSLLLLFCSCGQKEAVFKIRSDNFGSNAVIGIYDLSSAKPLILENIKNTEQSFRLSPHQKGYARLVLSSGGDQDFWIYLDNDVYEVSLDAANRAAYPVKNVSSPQGKEIIAFYQLEARLFQSVRDSLKLSAQKVNDASAASLEQALKENRKWQDRVEKKRDLVIKTFAEQYPSSMFSLFLMEHYGQPISAVKEYMAIFNGLAPEVKASREGKKMFQEFKRFTHLQPGERMAAVSGKNPAGQAFDPKILKKLNLFICWLSYDNSSRRNNVQLVESYEKYKDRDVEFISVSYDRYEKWWTAVIRDDGLKWPQYADLAGAKSPNPGNLSNYKAPYMFITDQSGIILSNDIQMGSLDFEIENRLDQVNNSD